jgi:hypothetical protein
MWGRMPSWLEFDRVAMPMVRQLHGIWQARRGDRDLPERADFDPVDLKSLLANMMIVEPHFSPFRLRYRLVGTRIVKVAGFDFTGRYLDEVLRPELPEDWHAHYHLAYQRRVPVFGKVDCPARDGTTFTYEFGLFPLSLGIVEDGVQAVGQFFSIEDFGALEPYSDQLSERL